MKATFRTVTWNVRNLYVSGTLDNAMKEMTALHINILGINDLRGPDFGVCLRDDGVLYYSGSDKTETE